MKDFVFDRPKGAPDENYIPESEYVEPGKDAYEIIKKAHETLEAKKDLIEDSNDKFIDSVSLGIRNALRTLDMENEIDRLNADGNDESKPSIENIAVSVENEKSSRSVQELFFKMGYVWANTGKEYVECCYNPSYIFLYDGFMVHSDYDYLEGKEYFNHQRLTAVQFLSMFGDSQASNQEDTSTVTMPESCRSYRKPKLVKALWLGQTEGDIECSTYESLLNSLKYVGVITECDCFKGKRMMVKTEGVKQGWSFAVNTMIENEETNYAGEYYKFESARDLYRWLAEGEG